MRHATRLLLTALILLGAQSGCRRWVVNLAADALVTGGSTFASDDDPELVKAAIPYGLKFMEGLLSESPRHKGLLLALARGFTQYSYAFVQQEADELEDLDVDAAFANSGSAAGAHLRPMTTLSW